MFVYQTTYNPKPDCADELDYQNSFNLNEYAYA